jgi:hypothetical protein
MELLIWINKHVVVTQFTSEYVKNPYISTIALQLYCTMKLVSNS